MGEYVQGTFTGQAGDPGVTWDSSYTTYSVGWETAGVRNSIQWSLPPSEKAELTPDDAMLVALAESLTDHPQPELNPNFMLSSADASLMAGFSVRVPGFTPKGWDQPFYTYDAATGFVCLNYATGGMRDHPRLFVRQSATAPITDLQPDGNSATPAPVQYEPAQVGGADPGTGRFTRSQFASPLNACNGQNEFFMTNEALQWTSQGASYEIFAANDPYSARSVSKLDLLRMAESITGVTTIPADAPDPEHLWSIKEAEKLAGFHVKAPAQLPEGYTFEMARLVGSTVISMYHAPDPYSDMLDLTVKPPVIYLYQCPAKTDGQDPCTEDTQTIPAEVREPVQVNHQPGFYAKGELCADESSNWKMRWVTEFMFMTRRLYWKEGDTVYLMQLMWGGLIDRETMIRIAESIK